jgi:UDP-N-acetylglucosamine acyltransferase
VIGAGVKVGEGTSIGPHVVIEGSTTIGSGNRVWQFATIGSAPQDLKYGGEPTRLEIGSGNTIREFSSINRGTVDGGGVTRVGHDNLLMAYSHVAHDCRIGDRVVMANAATLAGHVVVEDHAAVGGLVAIHQFVRVGQSAFLGGGAMVSLDIPPFCTAAGDRARLQGLNVVGLKRRGFGEATLKELREAYRVLFQSSLKLRDALEQLKTEYGASSEVMAFVDFVESSERGICR